jgi:type I restriction enzyme S subunit
MSSLNLCRLGDLFTRRTEKGRSGLPLLSVTINNGLVDRKDLDRKQDTSLQPHEHLLVKPGDIAYNTMRMWQGAFGLADREGLVSPAYVVLRPKLNADAEYVAQLLRTPRMRYLLRAYSYGLTDDRLRLYFEDFSAIPAVVPNIEEQRRIAHIFRTWDASILSCRQFLKNLKTEKDVLFYRFFGPKDGREISSASNASAYRTWVFKELGQIARITSGGTPDRSISTYWGGRVPWVTTGEIQFNTITETDEKITEEGLKNSSAKIFPPGTLLMAMYGQGKTRGQVAKLGINAATNQACAAILLKEEYDAEFYFQYFSAQYESIRELGNAGTQQNLSAGILNKLRVPVPSSDEQYRLAKILSTLDKQIQRTAEYIDVLQQEKEALMADLLTGARRDSSNKVVNTP